MKKNKKAFTLIELLAVIIILGVLMLVAIPSVTGYISSSRRSSYASTGSEFIKSVGVLVNKGTMPVFEKNTLYLFPIGNDETKSCVKLESGGKSPFDSTYKYAYVGALYDGISYDYYIISNDGANQGYRDDDASTTKDYAGKFIISSKRLEAMGGDLVKAGVEENGILLKYYSPGVFGDNNSLSVSSADGEWAAIATKGTEEAPVKGGIDDFVTKESITKMVFFKPSYCASQNK